MEVCRLSVALLAQTAEGSRAPLSWLSCVLFVLKITQQTGGLLAAEVTGRTEETVLCFIFSSVYNIIIQQGLAAQKNIH